MDAAVSFVQEQEDAFHIKLPLLIPGQQTYSIDLMLIKLRL